MTWNRTSAGHAALAGLLALAMSPFAHADDPPIAPTPDSNDIRDVTTEPRSITLDGEFDDWAGLEPVAAGYLVSTNSFVPDLGRVWCTFDQDWIYLRFETGRVVNLQAINGATLSLVFDADGNDETGTTIEGVDPAIIGADLALRFSPKRENAWFSGVDAMHLAHNEAPVFFNPYFLEAMASPTFAHDEFELRIHRGAIAGTADISAFRGDTFSAQFTLTDKDGVILDLTQPFQVDLTAKVPVKIATVMEAPLDRVDESAIRFVSWNVERAALFNQPDSFRRVLAALQPDVICFQELGEKATAPQLKAWLDEHLPTRAGWEVNVTAKTGTGVASRQASVLAGPARAHRLENGSTLRATSLLIGHNKRRVLVTSVHFTCCGRAGDKRDQKRIAQGHAVHNRLRQLRYELAPSGMVIMGDFNLVGSREPLDVIQEQNDFDATDLGIIWPMVLGGTTGMTWSDPAQPFLPGRLDYALFTDSVLELSRTFILDTQKLSEANLTHYSLQHTDTATASDHLPVVMDLVW